MVDGRASVPPLVAGDEPRGDTPDGGPSGAVDALGGDTPDDGPSGAADAPSLSPPPAPPDPAAVEFGPER
jgi:hypothetical protein